MMHTTPEQLRALTAITERLYLRMRDVLTAAQEHGIIGGKGQWYAKLSQADAEKLYTWLSEMERASYGRRITVGAV